MDRITALTEALEQFGATIAQLGSAEDEAVADAVKSAVVALVTEMTPAEEVVFIERSAGSMYFDVVFRRGEEEESVTVRASNHRAKPISHMPPVWSFDCGDGEKSILLGVSKIRAAIA